MNEKKVFSAGTDSKGDAIVVVSKGFGQREVIIESSVIKLFEKQMLKSIDDILDSYHVNDVVIKLKDRGALDYIIRARVEAAIILMQGGE